MNKTALAIFFSLHILFYSTFSHAVDGKRLYLDNCSSCHGGEGEGGKGLALNRQGFLAAASETYIVRTIYYGRPTRGCPPRKNLSKEEMLSIASYIKGWQKEKSFEVSERKVRPFPSDRGREIFNLCVGCHDANGVGAMGPSLIDPGFQASVSDAFLRATIMYGRAGTPMPGFLKGKGATPGIIEEDVDEVIAYIRYLGQNMFRGGGK